MKKVAFFIIIALLLVSAVTMAGCTSTSTTTQTQNQTVTPNEIVGTWYPHTLNDDYDVIYYFFEDGTYLAKAQSNTSLLGVERFLNYYKEGNQITIVRENNDRDIATLESIELIFEDGDIFHKGSDSIPENIIERKNKSNH